MAKDQIKAVALKALTDHLSPSIVTDLLVYEEFDADGDPILRFRVVINSDGPDLLSDKVLYATGVVRRALQAINESRFPIMSFPSSDEMSGVAA
jgi:hypothetical protein